MRNTRKVTLADVAAAAGVSLMTASRVMRRTGHVSARTRARVEAAAAELGYVANRIASTLAGGPTSLVGVVFPSLSNHVYSEVFAGISAVFDPTPLSAFVALGNYHAAHEEKVVRDILSWQPAGVILTGLDHTEGTREMLVTSGVPVVEIMDVDGVPIGGNVGISFIEAGALVAREVLASGYRRIALVGSRMPDDLLATRRMEGARRVLQRAGVPPVAELHDEGRSSIALGRRMTAMLLDAHPAIDCIIYSNDLIAAGGLLHCLAEGWDIPGRLGLVGFNAVDTLEILPLRLATVDPRRREIGETAARMIVGAALAPSGPPPAGKEGGEAARNPGIRKLAPRFSRGETLRPVVAGAGG